MARRSDEALAGLLGLGSQSARKSHYPELLARLEELEVERNRYKWLFEHAVHGIIQASLQDGVLAANPAMARMLGYDDPLQVLWAPDDLARHLFVGGFDELALIRDRLSQGQALLGYETRLRRRDGSTIDVLMNLLLKPESEGVFEGFVADITERKQAQQRLQLLNDELEQRVAARTFELLESNRNLQRQIEERERIELALREARDAAETANRSKDKYLAAASHDLLQPLNAARLLISTLRERALPSAEHNLVERSHLALEGAEDLLADLLDISKLDQQAMNPDLAFVDLQFLLKALGEEFDAVAGNAGLDFRIRTCPGLVKTDQRMLARIVRNLLSNAFRYTREGGILLSMRFRGGDLCIEIWDTGVGIEENKLQDIFTEFHQLLPQGTGGRQGVGLGLAIVERMVRVLGYRIDVVSRPGRGSRFAVWIPAEALTDQQPVPSEPSLPEFGSSLAGLRVLVIDNEPAILESMIALLERWGCDVTGAASDVDALEELTDVPQVILADFHLDNERTGCEAIHNIRRSLDKDIPAAIITADRSDETRKLLRAQYLPVLNKPVKPNRIRALLTSLLSPR